MFSTEEFKTFSQSNVMFSHVTTRIEGRKYDGLLSEKGGTGFPYIVALSPKGDVIAKAPGRSVEAFGKMMASANRFVEIANKAEKTLDDQLFIFEHQIDMGSLDFASAKTAAAAFEGLNEEQQAKIGAALTNLEITDALGRPKSREEAETLRKTAAVKFVAMLNEGRVPTSDAAFQPFYMVLMQHAQEAGDADLFEKAFGKMREKFESKPRAANWIKAQQKILDGLKSGTGDSDSGESDSDDDGSDDSDSGN